MRKDGAEKDGGHKDAGYENGHVRDCVHEVRSKRPGRATGEMNVTVMRAVYRVMFGPVLFANSFAPSRIIDHTKLCLKRYNLRHWNLTNLKFAC